MFAINSLNYPFALALRRFTAWWRIPHKFREKTARAFFTPRRQQSFPFRIRFRGIAYRGAFSDYVDWRTFFLGFERESLNLCAHLSKFCAGRAFADIGANKGLYSLALAKHFQRVVAFEPFAPHVERLTAAIAENELRNVEVFPFALGAANAKATYYVPPKENEGMGSFVQEHAAESSTTLELDIRLGDEVFAERNIRIGLVKIDTEGFEAPVLQGLRTMIERDKPFILLEIGDTTKSAMKAAGGLSALLPAGYMIFEVSEHSTNRNFMLRPLRDDQILTRPISNNLACPSGKLQFVEMFIR